MDFSRIRKEYSLRGLRHEDLHEDPFEQFAKWFKDAINANLTEPNAMSLATASTKARPSLRTVLLKGFDSRGFVFYTNYASRKAKELKANPYASLLFPWIELERQVVIIGNVQKISRTETLKYFFTRPLASKLSAWASRQSSKISSRKILEMQLAEIKNKFATGRIPLPDFWGGFRVVPQTIEFWQGRSNRMHDRFLYTKQKDGVWSIDRLSP